jgi:hypothetical protein
MQNQENLNQEHETRIVVEENQEIVGQEINTQQNTPSSQVNVNGQNENKKLFLECLGLVASTLTFGGISYLIASAVEACIDLNKRGFNELKNDSESAKRHTDLNDNKLIAVFVGSFVGTMVGAIVVSILNQRRERVAENQAAYNASLTAPSTTSPTFSINNIGNPGQIQGGSEVMVDGQFFNAIQGVVHEVDIGRIMELGRGENILLDPALSSILNASDERVREVNKSLHLAQFDEMSAKMMQSAQQLYEIYSRENSPPLYSSRNSERPMGDSNFPDNRGDVISQQEVLGSINIDSPSALSVRNLQQVPRLDLSSLQSSSQRKEINQDLNELKRTGAVSNSSFRVGER